MEENKKSKLGLGILIGVLATLVVGLSGFIIYDKVLSNNDSNQHESDNKVESDDNNKGENTTDNIVELSVDDDLVKKLHNLSGGEVKTTSFGLYNEDKILISELDLNHKENLLYLQLIKEEYDEQNFEEDYYKWYGNTVKSVWTKIFGSSTDFELSNKTVNGFTYQNDGSVTTGSSGRFEGINVYFSEVLKATQSSDEIILYLAVKFLDFDTENYYSNVEKTKLTSRDAEIPANYRKVFKKDIDGNYYFYSIEKIK